ncbi:proline-specific peptidase [Mycena vulgaris]|nr:proline-specific peptidase [Mycena vulgaris]
MRLRKRMPSLDIGTSRIVVVEGEIESVVPAAGKPYKTWYKVVGDLRGGARLYVALHGGPGVNHAYLLVLSDLTEKHGIPLIEKMNVTKFWTEGLYLDELDNLLRHLGIQHDYDILGHSPPGLKHLVLANTPASMARWIEAQNVLRAQLPKEIMKVLNKGQIDSEEYTAAMGQFYARHLCRMDEIPAPVMEGFGWRDLPIPRTGTSAFKAGDTLENWTMIADAHKIADSVLAPFIREISRVEWVTFGESSHMIHFEERERYMQIVGNFLGR